MKKLKSLFSFAIVMLFLTGMTFTSCGGKKDANTADDQTEVSDHPADEEHPADAEHPADEDTTEHPADAEHPADN